MNRNKLIIITGIILFFILVLYLANIYKANQIQEEKSNQASESISSLPEGQIAVQPDFYEIKKSVRDEMDDTQKNDKQVSEKIYKDKSGQQIVLKDFAEANEIKIKTDILQGSSQKDYMTFTCAKGEDKNSAIGIMLQQRRDINPEEYQQLFSKMEKNMEEWEGTIFNDLAPLFFSGESFQEIPKFHVSTYTTSNGVNIVQVHYANLFSVSKNEYSIDWGFLNDNLLVSNDRNCLRKMLDQNADAYEQ